MAVPQMLGITPAHDNPNFKLMRALGIGWVRQGFSFPFADRVGGELSNVYLHSEIEVCRYLDAGFDVLASFPGPGSVRYLPEHGETRYLRAMPDWLGSLDDDSYYEQLHAAARWLAERYKGRIRYWQVANEPDIDIFYGPLTVEQNARFLVSAATGLLAGNADAQPGINIGYINDYARLLIKKRYRVETSPFRYLGIDGYMGSWQAGGPASWQVYIDETSALSGVPIIINEWGFSSLQWGEKYTDRERLKFYNQDVCRNKYWSNTSRT